MAFRSHYTLQEMLWQTARANQEPEDSTQNSWNNRESGQSSGRYRILLWSCQSLHCYEAFQPSWLVPEQYLHAWSKQALVHRL
jgi:hypothetical protein